MSGGNGNKTITMKLDDKAVRHMAEEKFWWKRMNYHGFVIRGELVLVVVLLAWIAARLTFCG